jgi:group II intron reverse transcriptase/maturase
MEKQSELRNKYQQSDEAPTQSELIKKKKKEMTDAERVFALQSKLYHKAKQERGYKFYILYDKMFLQYMLREAWKQVKSNKGNPGVDGISIDDIEQNGVENYLEELGEDLRKQTYKPMAVKRVMIDKANGGKRPLGIPTVRDRIAQTVCKLILEPIFEADFSENSHGFRPQRSSKGAMKAIKSHLQEGKTQIFDADLSSFFDSIPHDKLYKALEERISDPRMLKLIKKWLTAPIHENGQFKGGKKNKTGTPQGGVISPLLANIYLNLLDRIVENTKKVFHVSGCKIVRYADDFVIMGQIISEQVKQQLHELIQRMGLSLNEEKTRIIDAARESFDFLGFTIRYDKDYLGRDIRYWNIFPSRKSEKKLRDKIRIYLKTHGHYAATLVARDLNSIVRGWLNYFEIKGVSYPAMSKRRLRFYISNKLYRYYNRKSQRKCRLYGHNAFEVLVKKFELIDPTKYTCR